MSPDSDSFLGPAIPVRRSVVENAASGRSAAAAAALIRTPKDPAWINPVANASTKPGTWSEQPSGSTRREPQARKSCTESEDEAGNDLQVWRSSTNKGRLTHTVSSGGRGGTGSERGSCVLPL